VEKAGDNKKKTNNNCAKLDDRFCSLPPDRTSTIQKEKKEKESQIKKKTNE